MAQLQYNWGKWFGQRVENQALSWPLKDWEKNFLWRVLFAGAANSTPDANTDRCERYLAVMQGNLAGVKPFDRNEINSFTWDYGLLSDVSFSQRFLRTVYLAVNFQDTDLAFGLRSRLEEVTGGNMLFIGLEQKDQRDFCRALYLILCFEFFNFLAEKVQMFVLSSDLMAMAVSLQFPIEEYVAEYLDSFATFSRRQDLAIDYAAFLLLNETPVGQRNGEAVTLKSWIELFRSYSEETLDAMTLIKFLGDEGYMGDCQEEEKQVVRAAIELYVHLVSGSLIVPDGNVKAVEELADQLAKTKSGPAGKGPNWVYLMNSPVINELQKQDIERWFNSAQSARAVKQLIVNSIMPVVDWAKEEKLANLLVINDLFEKRFGADAVSIVYFDEAQGKFVLNKE